MLTPAGPARAGLTLAGLTPAGPARMRIASRPGCASWWPVTT